MTGRRTRPRRSPALRATARITALALSATTMVAGAALTAQAVDVADPATCAVEDSCAQVELFIDSGGLLLDADYDALYDGGTTAELIDAGGQSVATASLTQRGGAFFEEFELVPPGTYTLKVNLPAGSDYYFGETTGWTADSATSDPIVVAGGFSHQRRVAIVPADATASIAMDVFSDMDRDGVADAEEVSTPGVAVTVSVGGTEIRRVSADNLSAPVIVPPGTYTVGVAHDSTWAPLNGTFGTSGSGTITVADGETGSVSFGLKDQANCTTPSTRCATVGVWAYTTDETDAKHSVAEGVQVAVIDVEGTTVAYASVVDGMAQFSVPSGYYTTKVVYSDGLEIAAGGDFDPATATSGSVLVRGGGSGNHIFNLSMAPGTGIGDGPIEEPEVGTVTVEGWEDVNGDGVRDDGDATADARAVVTGNGIDPTTVYASTPASFPEGDYTYDVSEQAVGWTVVGPTTGTFTLDGTYTIEVQLVSDDGPPAEKVDVTIDTYYDVNGNGTKDATEVPAPDLWFELGDGEGSFIAWDSTDDDGLAVFDELDAGTFTVHMDIDEEFDPAGLEIISGDLDRETRLSTPFTLAAGEAKTVAVGVIDDAHPYEGPGEPPAPIQVAAGGTVTVTGEAFDAGEDVEVWVHSDPIRLGQVTAEDDGTVTTTVTLPADLPAGAHRIELRGLTSGLSTWTDIVVAAAPTPPGNGGPGGAGGPGSLAETGAGQLGVMLLAVGLMLGIGGAMLRKPKQKAVAAA